MIHDWRDGAEPFTPRCGECLATILGTPGMIRANRVVIRPWHARLLYRGRMQYVVGYTWCRPGADRYTTGAVYDCVLGHGRTWAEAIDRAARRKPLLPGARK